MTRSEIITRFREENPEITTRVITDAVLKSWCEVGDKYICAEARCIVETTTFNSTSSIFYDLTAQITKFFDIDTYPGGGVAYDDEPLKKTTRSELNVENRSWRENSDGTPKKWYRYGKYLYFDRAPDTDDLDIMVDAILISDDFNNDNITPFNQLTHLEPFHYAIVLYLAMKAKMKVGKGKEAQIATAELDGYIKWMKKTLGGNKYGKIFMQKRI